MASASGSPVWFYVPNLVSYVRIVLALLAFNYVADGIDTASEFFWLYGLSYALDAIDGFLARKLGQTSSFGAVMDMVTDRFCTAGLLAAIAVASPSLSLMAIGLMILDLSSHWVHMYASLVAGKASHKDSSGHWLIDFYYKGPYVLLTLCIGNELFLLAWYMTLVAAETDADAEAGTGDDSDSAGDVLWAGSAAHMVTIRNALFAFAAVKQAVSVAQLMVGAEAIVAMDERKRLAQLE